MNPWVTAVGIVAGTLTAGSWVPQVIKTWRSRSAGDFSWGYLGAFTLGVMAWEVYGLLVGDIAVILANIITLLLLLVVIAIKLREKRPA